MINMCTLIFFVQSARILMLKGAELILTPNAYVFPPMHTQMVLKYILLARAHEDTYTHAN